MSAELLAYYNRELSFLRRLGAQFAEEHPKIARRLRLGEDASEDPHVERLIQAFAYLSARIRHKLDDDFPEISESLLGVLYPHYQAPVPSMSIIQFELDPQQNELTAGFTLPRDTEVETDPIQGEPCRFRTCYPVTLWPVAVERATLARPPVKAPVTPRSGGAVGVLRLVLRCRSSQVTFPALDAGSLRFFLKGQEQHVYRLYELILNNTLEVAVAASEDDQEPLVLRPDCLQAVGFERDEGMLPYSPRSFVGYRLLTEFFVFPEKFLFFELTGWRGRLPARVGNRMEVFLYLNRALPDLEPNVSADTFRLGCAPMVNLYKQRAEPLQLGHSDFEYRVVPDARRPLTHEVYSIDRVSATAPDGSRLLYHPFFSVKHAGDTPRETFWYASRRPPELPGRDAGTDVYLSLVDLDFRPSEAAGWVVDIETTCLNRDLPHRLPFGGDQPRLQLGAGGGMVSRVLCLTAPTRTLRPAMRQGTLWRLISHLSLGHLSLVDEGDQAEALREILLLYDFTDSAGTRKMIEGVLSVSGRRIVGRVGPKKTLCRGVEVTAIFDEARFTGSGLFLFTAVLERFLGLYCTLNSFTQLVARKRGGEGDLRRWPPRTGEKVVV